MCIIRGGACPQSLFLFFSFSVSFRFYFIFMESIRSAQPARYGPTHSHADFDPSEGSALTVLKYVYVCLMLFFSMVLIFALIPFSRFHLNLVLRVRKGGGQEKVGRHVKTLRVRQSSTDDPSFQIPHWTQTPALNGWVRAYLYLYRWRR